MTRIADRVAALQNAEGDIRKALFNGPKRTGELFDALGVSHVDFLMTQAIGDGRGRWDDSPHQLALADMVDSGEIRFWRDEKLDVWYGLAEDLRTPRVEECGDECPAVVELREFLSLVARRVVETVPKAEADEDQFNVLNIGFGMTPNENDVGYDGEAWDEVVEISVDGEKITVTETGGEEVLWERLWPGPTPAMVVAAVIEAIGKVRAGCSKP